MSRINHGCDDTAQNGADAVPMNASAEVYGFRSVSSSGESVQGDRATPGERELVLSIAHEFITKKQRVGRFQPSRE
jgi:hypothetical protein